jgi:hypothetical protein
VSGVNGAELQDRQEPEAKTPRVSEDLRQSLLAQRRAKLDEMTGEQLLEAVRNAKGNVSVAAAMLNVSVERLDRALFLTAETKRIAREMRRWQRKTRPAFALGTIEQVEADIQRKAILYKHEAMDVLIEIARQPLNENAYHNQIKLQAAMKLVDLPGLKLDSRASEEVAATLKLLDEEFRKNAPRLRVIRETVREMTFEPERGSTVEGRATARLVEPAD